MAQAGTELLMWLISRGHEQFVAARTATGRLFREFCWALALAMHFGNAFYRSLFHHLSLAYPLAIPATLLAATLAALIGLSPFVASAPTPPSLGRLLTCRTTISRLWISRLEELLTSLQ
jgi:hypothetical protein